MLIYLVWALIIFQHAHTFSCVCICNKMWFCILFSNYACVKMFVLCTCTCRWIWFSQSTRYNAQTLIRPATHGRERISTPFRSGFTRIQVGSRTCKSLICTLCTSGFPLSPFVIPHSFQSNITLIHPHLNLNHITEKENTNTGTLKREMTAQKLVQ